MRGGASGNRATGGALAFNAFFARARRTPRTIIRARRARIAIADQMSRSFPVGGKSATGFCGVCASTGVATEIIGPLAYNKMLAVVADVTL
jgi:hypothetical protein